MSKPPSKRLTDLELVVMRAVWDLGPGSVTVRDVVERLNAGDERSHAYTTVQTIMNILVGKGVLESQRGKGRALLYRADLSHEEATASMTEEFLGRLFGGRAEPLLARLLEHESVDRDTLAELKRAIEEQLGEEDDA